jgi:ADP-heptose:LPS heptosyltransferase
MSYQEKNILVYRLGSLGDTVMALPCFHKIRASYPHSKITLLTNKPVASKAAPLQAVLGDSYFFDDVLSYPVGTRNPSVLLKLNRKIRSLNIDTVVNITALRSAKADKRDKLFFQLAGVQNFIGFDNQSSDYSVSIDPITGAYEWEAKRLIRKIKSLGNIDLNDEAVWDLKLTFNEQTKANELLGANRFNDKIIVLNASTKMEVKDWGQPNWLGLIERLNEKLSDHFLIVIGVEEESPFAEMMLSKWKGEGLNLCGKCTPRESAAVLAYAKAFIGHDSGPMHLAACMGIPCIGIFSCINRPRQWYPRGNQNRIIMPDTDCAKNDIKGCVSAGENCISTIEISQVENEVVELLHQITLA